MSGLTIGSLCSGIDGFARGFCRAGHGPVEWFCEANTFRRKVLARHWPDVPIHEDLLTLEASALSPVDLLIGGTPCPDFSHAKAGRQGLEGDKSRLA